MRRLSAIAIVALVVQLSAQESRLVEWPYWGGDAANSRYSTLADITPANVSQLGASRGNGARARSRAPNTARGPARSRPRRS